MNNNRAATWVIIVLLIIAGVVYIAARSHQTSTDTTTPPSSTTTTPPAATAQTTYYCSNGTIVASYTDNAASLTLSDGRNLKLAQAVSGSGVRYESTDSKIAFITKGSNGFLQENNVTTYDNCVAGTQTTSGNSYTFTDMSKMFSFTYPNVGILSGSLGYDINWRQGTETTGLLLAEVTIPRNVQPKTNLSDSKFTIGTSSDPAAVKNCLTDNMGGSSKGTVVTVNGTQFTKLTASDAGAGNLYETTSYRTVKDNQCYAVDYTIHTTQLGNYDPSQGIKAYDKTAITAMFEGMVQSFKFLPQN